LLLQAVELKASPVNATMPLNALYSMIPKKACPGLDPGWIPDSEKVMLQQSARVG
jgi:hypothetical protein